MDFVVEGFVLMSAGADWYIQMHWRSWPVCLAAGLIAVCGHWWSLVAAGGSWLCSDGHCVCSGSIARDWHTFGAWAWWWSACCPEL